MKTATIVLKAYVVGPRTSASSRVQTTCSVSEAKPEMPSAAAASQGERSAGLAALTAMRLRSWL